MRLRTAVGWGILAGTVLIGSAARAAVIQATFTDVKGDVKISTAAASRWREAEKGMRCGPGATIKTGIRGYAQLLFDDESALRIEKNTKLTLQRAETKDNTRNFFVQMFNGRLLSNVPKSNKFGKTKFQVRTPLCSAAVRGTQFVTDSSSSAASVAVYEGSVATENPSAKGEVEVAAHQQTEISGERPPAAPHALSREMEQYQKDVAALFAQYADGLRANMEAVRQMNQEYMDRHQQEMQEGMDDYNNTMQDAMEEYRKKVLPEGQ